MLAKTIALMSAVGALGAPSANVTTVAHCRDCGAEIDRRDMFCAKDRDRRLTK